MIRQKAIIIKTDSATLTIAEMGDIIGNKATDLTLTLPAPVKGLWYRISNVGAGVLTVFYGSALTTLKQTEQCLCLANATSAWFFSKGGGAMTKEEIEAVLTGELTSHSHAVPAISFEDLDDVPAYTGNAGKMPKVNATADGIEFVDGGVAENGIPTGGTTDQLFAKNSNTDYDGKWVDAPQASNGLPTGGTAGQGLVKDSATDFDSSWGDVDAVKILAKPVNIADFTGKDDYVLAYDETNGEFYLKLSSGGGGDETFGTYAIALTLTTNDIA